MDIILEHQTVACPKCGKDSWLTKWEVGKCFCCNTKIKYGVIDKQQR